MKLMGIIQGQPTPIEVHKVPDPKYAVFSSDEPEDSLDDFHFPYLWRATAPDGTYADGDTPEEAVDEVCS